MVERIGKNQIIYWKATDKSLNLKKKFENRYPNVLFLMMMIIIISNNPCIVLFYKGIWFSTYGISSDISKGDLNLKSNAILSKWRTLAKNEKVGTHTLKTYFLSKKIPTISSFKFLNFAVNDAVSDVCST